MRFKLIVVQLHCVESALGPSVTPFTYYFGNTFGRFFIEKFKTTSFVYVVFFR